MNPFKYGQIVSAKDFCPRPLLMKQLSGYIKTGQNVVLHGERRVGKTSLVYESIRRSKGYRMLYVDLMEIKTTTDLCRRIVTSIISLEKKAGLLENILRTLSQLKPVISIDPLTGQPSITLDAGVKLRPESIDGLLDLIVDINKRKPLVVILDEFQSILNLSDARETLAVLRSKIQFQSDIAYVFAGSIRNQMVSIFTDPDSAFFKSAVPIDVGPLETESFMRFLLQKFSLGGRSVQKEVIAEVFGITANVPGDVQALCSCFWEISEEGDRIDRSYIFPSLELIYARESKEYELHLTTLTGQQFKCLIGLARKGGKSPLSADFLKGSGITLPASVKKALNRLIQNKIIYRHEGEYKFVNPFFRSWLIWKNY